MVAKVLSPVETTQIIELSIATLLTINFWTFFPGFPSMRQLATNTDIYTVDALYHGKDLASIHLIREGDRIAIIDTGTNDSCAQVKAALTELGLSWNDVDYIILTHIHLDHAGGASALMALCDNAKLVVHEKGARHMANPEKLIAGTIAVYGKKQFDEIYGEIKPIDPERTIVPADGDALKLVNRELKIIDSPGHADHHFCIFDKKTNSMFTGDTVGVAYRALRSEKHSFMLPTVTPIQFNPEKLHASIDKVMAYQPDRLYVTHYSMVEPSAANIAGLHEQIDDFVMLTQQAASQDGEPFEDYLEQSLLKYLLQRCQNEVPSVPQEEAAKWLSFDAKLNMQGLVFWWNYRRQSEQPA